MNFLRGVCGFSRSFFIDSSSLWLSIPKGLKNTLWFLPTTTVCDSGSPCLTNLGIHEGDTSFQCEFFCPKAAPCSARLFCISEKCWVIVWWLHPEKSLYIYFCCVPTQPFHSTCWTPLLDSYFSILLKRVFRVI